MADAEGDDSEEKRILEDSVPTSYDGDHNEQEEDNKDFKFWSSGKAAVVLCILFTELCERLTYYSINANLVLYCTSVMRVESATAIIISQVFVGTSYFLPVFGGYIADTLLGKFNTIYASALIYFIGAALLPVVSVTYPEDVFSRNARFAFFIVALLLVSIGTGGIKANVGPFGAQQLAEFGEGAIQSFFNWFYWFINVGSAVSFSLVVYIQQEISFVYGFLIPAFSIILATVLFMLQRNHYITTPPEGSALTNFVKVTAVGTCGCCKKRSVSAHNIQSKFDYAKQSQGGDFPDDEVEDTKTIYKFLPIFGTFVLYWTIYNQMSSSYYLQGERLRLQYGKFVLPVAILNLFDIIIILLLVPLFDRLFYPFIDRLGINFTQLRRIGTGMVLAIASMLVAAVVEWQRKEIMQDGGIIYQNLSSQVFNASDLSVMVQIPQFMLIGASEIFTSITGLEFAYSQSPVALQGVVMGLFLMATGLGSYVGSLLVLLVNACSKGDEWIPDEINDGHLEFFFLLLAGLMAVNFLVYIFLSTRYKYASMPLYADDADAVPENGARPTKRKKKRYHGKSEILSESEI